MTLDRSAIRTDGIDGLTLLGGTANIYAASLGGSGRVDIASAATLRFRPVAAFDVVGPAPGVLSAALDLMPEDPEALLRSFEISVVN